LRDGGCTDAHSLEKMITAERISGGDVFHQRVGCRLDPIPVFIHPKYATMRVYPMGATCL